MATAKWALVPVLITSLFIAGCGEDKDSPVIQTGVFVDAPVANIGFQTATQSGVTDAQGQFSFLGGERVTFSFGSITLPPVTAKDIVTPVDIAQETDNSANINSPVAVNIARLLQSVDADDNPDNGIEIPANLNPSASIDFTADSATFEAAFAAEFPAEALVSEADATAHLQEQIDDLANGGDPGGDGSGGGDGGGSTAQICPFGGDPTPVTSLPSALASQVFDLVVTTENAGSPVALDQSVNFTFSSSGALFVDNTEISAAPYQCAASTAEFLWFDEPNNVIYAVAVINDALHEVTVLNDAGTFFASLEEQSAGGGGGTQSFSISGSITNPDNISGQWELFINGSFNNDGSLATTSDISFTAAAVDSGASYEVRPSASECSVTNGSGTVTANIDNVLIDCVAAAAGFSISGTVNGASDADGTVQVVNGSSGAPLAFASVTFTGNDFTITGVAEDSNFAVVFSNTGDFFCSRNSSAEGILTADITDAVLNCTPQSYAVSGQITGISAPAGLSLELRAQDGTVLSTLSPANVGSFSFDDRLSNSTAYTVVITANPANASCSLTNASGSIAAANVFDVVVNCVADAVAGIQKVQEGNFIKVVFGTDRFVALANDGAYMSLDGVSWTKATNAGTGSDVAFDSANNQFIIAPGAFPNTTNGGTLFTSTDGLDWTSVSSNQCSAACLGAQFLAVSNGNYVLSTSGAANRQVVISSDLTNWTSVDTGANSALTDVVAFGAAGNFVGISRDGEVVVSSDNGATWSLPLSLDTGVDLAVSDTLVFSLGEGNSNGFKIDQSSDGTTWVNKLLPITITGARTLHVGTNVFVGAAEGVFAGATIETVGFLQGVDAQTVNVPTQVKSIAENNGTVVFATADGIWSGQPVLAAAP